MSEQQITTVHELLVYVQANLKVPKTHENEFGGFVYRSTEDILEAAIPLVTAHGGTLTLLDKIVLVGDRYYVNSGAVLSLNEAIIVDAWAREPLSKPKMDESQTTGSASSYARKRALEGLFALDDGETPDSEVNTVGDVITEEQARDINTLLKDTGSDLDAFLKWVSTGERNNVTSIERIPAKAYDSCIKALERKKRDHP